MPTTILQRRTSVVVRVVLYRQETRFDMTSITGPFRGTLYQPEKYDFVPRETRGNGDETRDLR